MKIVVLGASGGVGRLVVQQAAEQGHDVIAVGRGAMDIAPNPRVTPERGSLTDVAFLSRVIAGSDVVISCLGLRLKGLAPWNLPEVPDFLDTSTAAIVTAMKTVGVSRLVVVSSSGIGDSAALLPGFFRAFIAVSAMRHVWPALNRMEEAFARSGLHVTFVRPTGLTDGPATGRIVEATRLVGQAQIARADVAAFMLKEAARNDARRAVVITTTGAG
jgi:nucleoside-diphosphate-sugar epimerase